MIPFSVAGSSLESDVSEVFDEDKFKTSLQRLWERNNEASPGIHVSHPQ
jgi:hypothetical protein